MAQQVAEGSVLKAFSLPDQRDQRQRVDEETRILLFSRDREVSKMAFGFLGEQKPSFLAEKHASIVVDISKMPSVITWAVAKPKLRKHAFPILLDSEPGPTKDLPAKPGHLTLLFLERLKVRSVKFVSTASELQAELGR